MWVHVCDMCMCGLYVNVYVCLYVCCTCMCGHHQDLVSYPDPDSHSLQMDYITATVTKMLGNQSDSRYGVIAYLSYYWELLVIAMVLEDVRRTIK